MDEPGDTRVERLTAVFRALADPARLRILGAIAERPMTGRELSDRLGLTPPTISHHMARLTAAELVVSVADSQRRYYSLDEGTLRGLGREHAADRVVAEDVRGDGGADERLRAKILRDFFDGARLTQIPAQRKKRVIVLQHVLERFAPDRDYPESEVNALLRKAHDDVATLRRELVDYGYLTRAAGIYRVADAAALPPRGPTVAQEIGNDEHAWLRSLVAGATRRALADG